MESNELISRRVLTKMLSGLAEWASSLAFLRKPTQLEFLVVTLRMSEANQCGFCLFLHYVRKSAVAINVPFIMTSHSDAFMSISSKCT